MSFNNGNVFLQVKPLGERQENIATNRTTLKPLKNDNIEKENSSLFGKGIARTKPVIDATTNKCEKRNAVILNKNASTQSESHAAVITEADLTSTDAPSESYYKHLAEHRRVALHQSLIENQYLSERIESLEEELDTSRKELDEAVHLTEILKEFLSESNNDGDYSENEVSVHNEDIEE